MSFYIYKNIPNKKVTIHRGECRHCNYGNGLQRNKLGNANGYWLPAVGNGYLTYQSATAEANKLAADMGITTRNCMKCNSQ